MKTERFDFDADAGGHRLAGALDLPAGPPRAFALFAHCFTCSKNLQASTGVSRALAARGYGVLRFDFTGLGGSEGEFANTSFSSNVGDLVAAARALHDRHGPPRLLVGHSLGGAAVLRAAARIESATAVATIGAPSSPSHLDHVFASSRAEVERTGFADVVLAGRTFRITRQFLADLGEHDMRTAIGGLGRPLLVMHAPDDDTVDVEHATRIFVAAKHPKSFVALGGADHLLSGPNDAAYVGDVIAAWASRYVPAPT